MVTRTAGPGPARTRSTLEMALGEREARVSGFPLPLASLLGSGLADMNPDPRLGSRPVALHLGFRVVPRSVCLLRLLCFLFTLCQAWGAGLSVSRVHWTGGRQMSGGSGPPSITQRANSRCTESLDPKSARATMALTEMTPAAFGER